jgi:hypothetical protein
VVSPSWSRGPCGARDRSDEVGVLGAVARRVPPTHLGVRACLFNPSIVTATKCPGHAPSVSRVDAASRPTASNDGVRSLDVQCNQCRDRVILNVDHLPRDLTVPSFGPKMVCAKCGTIGADVPVTAGPPHKATSSRRAVQKLSCGCTSGRPTWTRASTRTCASPGAQLCHRKCGWPRR